MPRILHIFPAEKFTGHFVDFINNNFPKEEHLFFVMGDNNKYQDLSHYDNVVSARKNDGKLSVARSLMSLMRSSEKTIIHGLFDPRLMLLIRYCTFFKPSLNSRLHWVIWGGDLYCHILRERSLKSDIYECLRKSVISNLGNIVALVPGDYKLAQKWYKAKGRNQVAFYPNPVDFSMLERAYKKEANRNNGNMNILLGNSASSSNNHFDAIDLLSKFKSLDFTVSCPLSYGNMDYAKEVIAYGKKKLGNKFEAITDFLKPEEYANILASVDAAIMYHNRQQAVHNILSLLYLGKKVFLRSEVTTYSWLKNDLGLEVYDANLLNDYEMAPDLYLLEEAGTKNKEIVKEFFSVSNCRRMWNEVFES